MQAKHWYFNERPSGMMDSNTLIMRTEPVPDLSSGEVLMRTRYLSLDATNRVWLSDWSIYMEPVAVGQKMLGFVLAEVVQSANDAFQVGDLCTGLGTWSDYFVTDGEGFVPFPAAPDTDLALAFGILAIAGPTAMHGLLTVGRPSAGQTVLVSAAAGAVGQLVGQIAHLQGCKTIGIAGGQAKCELLTQRYGYDHAVDYKQGDLVEQLRQVAPEGVDVLFENVGGDVLDAGLTVMNDFGTVVVCGLISTYNSADPEPGPYMFRNVIMRRLRVEGFVILDHADQFGEYISQLQAWMSEGKIHYDVHIEDGIESAADALQLLYTGGNTGKLMVQM